MDNCKKNPNKILPAKFIQGKGGHVLDADYFYFDTPPTCRTPLAIVCGGYEKCAPDFEINRSNYPYYFIKCTVKGRGTLEIKNRRYELKRGVITGFGPGTAHHYLADPKNPMEHIFVTFLGTESKKLLKAGQLSDTGILELSNPAEALEAIEKIFAVGMEKKQYSQQICCNYLRILLMQLGQEAEFAEKYYSQSKATYLRCRKYIDDNFSEISSPSEAAEKCGINLRYMSALFKRCCQSSPHEYIMRLKLNKAANLLLTSVMSVKEIAHSVGFSDPYHFSRNFTKYHLLSPRNYRSRWQRIS